MSISLPSLNCCETEDPASICHEANTIQSAAKPVAWPWWVKSIEYGLYQSQAICLEKVTYPPKRIVVVGGCRQRQIAEQLAFQYPDAKIALLDPDLSQVEQAKSDIHCRFHFMHAAPESIPLPDDSIDLLIAHQLADYTEDIALALQELSRITRHHMLISVALPNRSKLARLLPSVSQWMQCNGMDLVTPTNWNGILTGVLRNGRIKKYLEPLPWRMILVEMKPVKEERLILP